MKRVLSVLSISLVAYLVYRMLFSYVILSSPSFLFSYGYLNSKEFFPKYVFFNPCKKSELYSIVERCVNQTIEEINSDTFFLNNVSNLKAMDCIEYQSKYQFYKFFMSDTLPFLIESFKYGGELESERQNGENMMILIVKRREENGQEWEDAMLRYNSDTSYEWFY